MPNSGTQEWLQVFFYPFPHHTLLEIIHFLLYFTSQYTKYMGTFES
jgi:hypothetical protein